MKTTQRTAYSYFRFSSGKQADGDSVRRQTVDVPAYCLLYDWKLDTNLTYADKAVSSFHGKNAKTGSLAGFLAAVREGTISHDSILIVEDVDRLSRQEPLDSLDLIREIVKSGIELVTLSDGQHYTKQSLQTNAGQLFVLLGKIIRAHEESLMKSKRTKAWRLPRVEAARTKREAIRQRLPGWIRRNAEGALELVPEKAAIMRRIVQMGLDGIGGVAIARILNREGVPPIANRSTTKAWTFSVPRFYLTSRLLIGEYQPCTIQPDGSRSPNGQPIKNYYPPLIEEETFYRLQAVVALRAKGKRKGNEGKGIANLFGQILINGDDRSTLYLTQKRKENLNMISAKMQKAQVPTITFSYRHFECAFLRWISEVHLLQSKPVSRVLELEARLSEVTEKIHQVNRKIAMGNGVFDRLLELLETLGRDEASLKDQFEEAKAEQAQPDFDARIVAKLSDQMRTLKGEELNKLRSRLRVAIASSIDSIELFPAAGASPSIRHAIAIVWLRGGLYRVVEIRYERGHRPIYLTQMPDLPAAPHDVEQLRSSIARYAKIRAMDSYDTVKADGAKSFHGMAFG
jgi:DNA invertase Pin-like site-specific DNA recombinase